MCRTKEVKETNAKLPYDIFSFSKLKMAFEVRLKFSINEDKGMSLICKIKYSNDKKIKVMLKNVI